jgi:hypothetical protein
MRLYIEGHNVRLGYLISREFSDDECRAPGPCKPEEIAPVRHYNGSLREARRLVDRWNRMFATHGGPGDAKEDGND